MLVRSSGRVLLIDTGPDPELLRRCLAHLGLARVDLLVLTHFDKDHAGGAPALTGRVDEVRHGPPDGAQDERLLRRLSEGGARVTAAAAGQEGLLGEARWRVLWPRRVEPAFPPGNDLSVVLEVEGGGVPRSIFLGDMSAESQAVLGRRVHPHGYAVVKVAHHGSADQDPALYAALAPAVALVSVGAGNDYGHPRRETLEILRHVGARILRTDESGMILLGLDGERIRLWSERSAP
ncbi:beta-lactamase superfamily II metal-dependent hydrolase [Microbacterium resistens]|uniref:Beta-lactamase superfamily II metal-dependent hydrolase n=1 Tax=Microbacterium resistens TaxID=156977 RepID=A0ABU1SGE7_9MICO|nr:beta-lactamase superfamily II metal-dependent hydrolase [Microbacterium resistens]